MGNSFNYENKVAVIFTKAVDAVVLGLLWVICSLPIITIGASSTAFYYAFNKTIREERGYAWEEYMHSFKSNFKQATKGWLVILAIIMVTFVDYRILTEFVEMIPFAEVLRVIMLVIICFGITWGQFLFAYFARFEGGVKEAMRNSIFIILANLLWAILLLIIWLIAVIVFLSVPFLSFIIFAVYMFFANMILEHIFKKYISETI